MVMEVENSLGKDRIPDARRTGIAGPEPGSLQSHTSKPATHHSFMITFDDRILVTGAAGFIGARVVKSLVDRGFRNLVCFARPSSELGAIQAVVEGRRLGARIDVLKGNLLSRADCETACKDATVIYHLAAATGEKSFPDAFMNSVVTTRNLLEASLRHARLRRFVLVSSFSVYTNRQKSWRLDESCPIEEHPELRGDAYCFAKVKQEQIVTEYERHFGIPFVVVRPGSVYGAGKGDITSRVGLGTFGLFLHLGGSNTIPFTHVDNCAEAIVLAGLVKGVDGEVFNVVDDGLPSSRQFLRQYKKNVRRFKSVYVPHMASLGLCYLWEKYSQWSKGQLPNAFNRKRWYAEWKKAGYSNEKLKARLGWTPKVATREGLRVYFQSCAQGERHA
jgi:nucleoside-diphosphate-sugar epimerase